MEIAIFESVTTESALTELEAEGKKYDGLYVDMEDAPQRKYVKDKAAEIQSLIKKVNAHRIADKKAYGVKVEAQAAAIISRLTDANSNFQVLIDDYTIERKKILDAEKAHKATIIAKEQFENDHEIGLLMNKTFAYDRQQAIDAQAARDKQIADEAAAIAIDQQNRLAEAKERDRVNDENARLANVEHVRTINRAIYMAFVSIGLDNDSAKLATQALIDNKITQTTINY